MSGRRCEWSIPYPPYLTSLTWVRTEVVLHGPRLISAECASGQAVFTGENVELVRLTCLAAKRLGSSNVLFSTVSSFPPFSSFHALISGLKGERLVATTCKWVKCVCDLPR